MSDPQAYPCAYCVIIYTSWSIMIHEIRDIGSTFAVCVAILVEISLDFVSLKTVEVIAGH